MRKIQRMEAFQRLYLFICIFFFLVWCLGSTWILIPDYSPENLSIKQAVVSDRIKRMKKIIKLQRD